MKNNKREPPDRRNLHNALRGATFICIIGVTAVGAIGLWSSLENDSNDAAVENVLVSTNDIIEEMVA
jgi:hypothetical protein